ncbi:hypothetical protein D3C77_355230 [compost metagenome]
MYIVSNQLHTHPALNMGEDGSDHRYFILKAKPEYKSPPHQAKSLSVARKVPMPL